VLGCQLVRARAGARRCASASTSVDISTPLLTSGCCGGRVVATKLNVDTFKLSEQYKCSGGRGVAFPRFERQARRTGFQDPGVAEAST
jgi:hypothetical protein